MSEEFPPPHNEEEPEIEPAVETTATTTATAWVVSIPEPPGSLKERQMNALLKLLASMLGANVRSHSVDENLVLYSIINKVATCVVNGTLTAIEARDVLGVLGVIYQLDPQQSEEQRRQIQFVFRRVLEKIHESPESRVQPIIVSMARQSTREIFFRTSSADGLAFARKFGTVDQIPDYDDRFVLQVAEWWVFGLTADQLQNWREP